VQYNFEINTIEKMFGGNKWVTIKY
jgi:hypothetical protein